MEKTEVVTPPAEEPQVSLAEHEAAFAPAGTFAEAVAQVETPPIEADDDEPIEPTSGQTRHKAASQIAKPEDVAAIADLTKRVRAAEKELGIERKPGESSRVFNLRKQVEIAERLKNAPKPVAVSTAPPTFTPPPTSTASAFSKPEPTQAQFMQAPDPYMAFVSAHTRWEWEKDQFDAAQATAKTQQDTDQKARQEKFAGWVKTTEDSHVARMTAFITQKPEAKAELEAAGDLELSPIMYGAVTLSERGPEIMVEYARHPEVVDDLLLQTAGRPLILPDGSVNPLVAIVQRRVLARLAVASTGSTPARIVAPTPRPPNPVRTAPQMPSATPPGDGATLAQHENFYGPKSRRR